MDTIETRRELEEEELVRIIEKIDNLNLGRLLKLTRYAKDIKVEFITQLVKIDKSSVSRYEANKQEPTAKAFLKLIYILGLQNFFLQELENGAITFNLSDISKNR